MPGLDWLTARPIAHRGLHGLEPGVIENTAGAFTAAIRSGYAIETDLQLSADGEAMVHHDEALGRLTEGRGRLAELTAAQLQTVRFKASRSERMMTLGELCDLVAGRAGLVIELKSAFDGNIALARRACAILRGYCGPCAVMSFDSRMIEAARALAPELPRGIVAERRYDHAEWGALSAAQRLRLAYFLHASRTRPHFIAYAVRDLPALAPWMARQVFGLPLLTWTVRTEAERAKAARYADQMIFEGFRA
jgi:glycerophosphoryl diester phosphodiesterase